MRLQELRQHLINVLAVAVATLGWIFMVAWVDSRELDFLGPQVSGVFLVVVLPLLVGCLAAALAGAGLAYFLRTDRPVVFGILFGGALVLVRWTTMTIGQPGWQGAVWIAADLLLPALVAAMVTPWLYRRREAEAAPA